MAKLAVTFAIIAAVAPVQAAVAYDFLEKRECTIEFLSRAPVHTSCIVNGGMMGGTIDVEITTPDGKRYALEGPVDGEEGSLYLLQKSRAKAFSREADPSNCYQRNDGKLTICLGKKLD